MFVVQILDAELKACRRRAERMLAGAQSRTCEGDNHTNADTFLIGNIGELAVGRFLRASGFEIIHQPFREDYSEFNLDDDFIVRRGDELRQIDVKTRPRPVEPAGLLDNFVPRIELSI